MQYDSQYTDTETGLIFLRARYYDPATGQFLSVDPMAEMTQARYNYPASNPLRFTDPTGQVSIGKCLAGAIGVIVSWVGSVCVVSAIDDRNGDLSLGFTKTTGHPNFVPGVAGIQTTTQLSDARTVAQLGGPFFDAGGSAGGVGADFFGGSSCGGPDNHVVGVDIADEDILSFPISGEVHVGDTNTSTWSIRIPGWALPWNA